MTRRISYESPSDTGNCCHFTLYWRGDDGQPKSESFRGDPYHHLFPRPEDIPFDTHDPRFRGYCDGFRAGMLDHRLGYKSRIALASAYAGYATGYEDGHVAAASLDKPGAL